VEDTEQFVAARVRGESERDDANRSSVLGRPLQQAVRLVRASLVCRVAHRTLSGRDTYAVGRREAGGAMRPGATD
jgi:ribose/xylose/arabinose/galactoside ABC-type transport system permease subunit